MGLLVTDGVIRSGYNYTWAVGFMEDGTVIMGDPKLSIKMSYTHTVTEPAPSDNSGENGGETTGDSSLSDSACRQRLRTNRHPGRTVTKSIYTVNKARDTSGIYLYTNDFNAKGTTGCTEAGVDVVLVPADGSANAASALGRP